MLASQNGKASGEGSWGSKVGTKQVEQGDRGARQGGEDRVDIAGQQSDGQRAHGGGHHQFGFAEPADLQGIPLIVGRAGPGVPAVDVGAEEEQLQHQESVELDLEEDDGKQADVDQAKQVVDGFLLTGEPDTGQTKQGADGFNP